jgi:hypothetical protein
MQIDIACVGNERIGWPLDGMFDSEFHLTVWHGERELKGASRNKDLSPTSLMPVPCMIRKEHCSSRELERIEGTQESPFSKTMTGAGSSVLPCDCHFSAGHETGKMMYVC